MNRRAEIKRRNFENFGCALDDCVRERERKWDDDRSVWWCGMKLELENIRYELVTK